MADQAPKPSAAPDRSYKRSWKNLLINKRYQLRFTLFMVGIAMLLMTGLGYRVMTKAIEATTVSKTHVLGEVCPTISLLTEDVPPPVVPMKLDEPAPDPAAPAKAADAPKPDAKPDAKADAKPDDKPDDKDPPRHVKVQLDESSLTLTPTVPVWTPPLATTFVDEIAAHWKCQISQEHQLYMLDLGRLRILLVLIGSGLLLVFGLAIYGIKMTHKVAGPLFKVGLYFTKMQHGKLDKVYNLRKGDQLVDFYEHFKTAHAGVVQLEKDDIVRLKAVIAAAEAAGQGEHAAVSELRDMLARKEKALE